MRRAVLLAVSLLASLAFAVTYRVVDEGGPLTLRDDVAAAFAAWNEVEDADVDAETDDDANTVVRYGDSARFGPDTVSLTTLERQDNERVIAVLLNPTAGTERSTALLHETGVLLGLTPAGDGVMDPLLGPDSPQQLTDADRNALRSLRQFVPADINRDGVVDFYDLAALGTAYGQRGVNVPADIDNDGDVDDRDLELLRDAYSFGPPSETPPSATPAETPPEETGTQLPVSEEEFPRLEPSLDNADTTTEDDVSDETSDEPGDGEPGDGEPGDSAGDEVDGDVSDDTGDEADDDAGDESDDGSDDGVDDVRDEQ
ncbi:MAG: hypothetical protein U5L04_04630 [Trueperaceae bacterium]|nr:hypothetical protein [Trueperaceae bacterium]